MRKNAPSPPVLSPSNASLTLPSTLAGLAAGIAYLRTLKQRQRIGGSAGMGPSGPAFAYAPYTDETGGAGGGGGFVPGGYGVPAGVTPLAPAPAPGAGGWFRVA